MVMQAEQSGAALTGYGILRRAFANDFQTVVDFHLTTGGANGGFLFITEAALQEIQYRLKQRDASFGILLWKR